jgi:hypothetical protein
MKKFLGPSLWLSSLFFLYFMDPGGPSLCIFKFAGMDACPGCGLGHSMHAALHLDFAKSFDEHVLGLPAIAGIIYIFVKSLHQIKTTTHGSATFHDAAGPAA